MCWQIILYLIGIGIFILSTFFFYETSNGGSEITYDHNNINKTMSEGDKFIDTLAHRYVKCKL